MGKSAKTPVARDIVIAGAGPVGLTLALALALARSTPDLDIALVDARPIVPPADARASAISPGARAVFEALGIWAEMAGTAEPVHSLKVTDSAARDIFRPLYLRFDGDQTREGPIAHMVPNRDLVARLIEACRGAGIELRGESRIAGFAPGKASARLDLERGGSLDARLVAAADGGRSALRAMAGIGVIQLDYRQTGLVTTIEHEVPHHGAAFEHFLPAGPFATLPLQANRSSLVWTESPEAASRMRALDAAALSIEIETRMGLSLGRVTPEEPLQGFPLHLVMAREMVRDRLALVGDAAHVIHPLAGQGLNLGIKDVAALAETIVEAVRLGEDFGSLGVLLRYQNWRRFDSALMAVATDSLNRLFSNDFDALRRLRDTGMGIVDRLPGLKTAIIAQAGGRGGAGAPKLLRGLTI